MAISVTHSTVVVVADDGTSPVGTDEWNAAHTVTGAAESATTITAGAGLTGGGDLSANRTIDVGAGTGITVNANDVALDLTHDANALHPSSSTDNAIARYDSTSGNIQNSSSSLEDDGSINIPSSSAYKYNSINIAYAVPDGGGGQGVNYFFGGAGNFTTTGSGNLGAGPTALDSLTSGDRNVAVGHNAMTAATSASRNAAIGHRALEDCTEGVNNMAVDQGALANLTTANDNVAIGSGALASVVTDSYNVAIGTSTLEVLNGGNQNAGVGYAAGADVTTGSNNTFVGNNTGRGITTGSNNTVLGGNVSGLSGSLSGNVIIATGNGQIRAQSDNSTGMWTLLAGLKLNEASPVLRTGVSWSDGAGAQTATLTNSPAAGNPTKWVAFDDNGTTRYVPMW